jgi:single-stranded DNA-binding protein
MSVHVLATGRLIAEPVRRETKNGDPMAFATLAAAVPLPRDAEGDPSMLIGVICFGAAADGLLSHDKGDTIAVSGQLQRSRWTSEDGAQHERLGILADTVTSARTARRAASARTKRTAGGGDRFHDDPIRF